MKTDPTRMMDKVRSSGFKQWVKRQSESFNLIGWAFSIFTCFVEFKEANKKILSIILLGLIKTKFLDTET
jgi:hypothetical protein